MSEITVTVPAGKAEEWKNSVHIGNYVLQELLKKGAPVEGGVFFTRVSRGQITITEDAFGDMLVTWSE